MECFFTTPAFETRRYDNYYQRLKALILEDLLIRRPVDLFAQYRMTNVANVSEVIVVIKRFIPKDISK